VPGPAAAAAGRSRDSIGASRALFTNQGKNHSGFIVNLRGAMRLTQNTFARRLGVSKMTVSRWECGRMTPGESAVAAIRELQAESRRAGVKIDGEKPAGMAIVLLPRRAAAEIAAGTNRRAGVAGPEVLSIRTWWPRISIRR